jgi:hypothetical protein
MTRLAKAWRRQIQVACLVAVVLTVMGQLRDWGSEFYFLAASSIIATVIQMALSRVLLSSRRGQPDGSNDTGVSAS